MKIANVVVGSMKTNGSRLYGWLQKSRPDIVTLQKIGSENDFPVNPLHEMGYESEFLGRRSPSDLGVAILSLQRPEMRACEVPGAEERESRFLTVDIGALCVSSVYAPLNPKSEHPKQAIKRRVAWLNRLLELVDKDGCAFRDSLLCGDFNVKFKTDGRRKDESLYSQDEEDVLQELLDLGFYDLYREAHRNPKQEPGYTRGYSEKCPNGTSRLHLMLASKSLKERLRSADVDIESKLWPRKDAPALVVILDDA